MSEKPPSSLPVSSTASSSDEEIVEEEEMVERVENEEDIEEEEYEEEEEEEENAVPSILTQEESDSETEEKSAKRSKKNGDGEETGKSTEKTKTTATPAKRTNKTEKLGDSKRSKKNGDGEETEKKSANKLWSEEDELAVLKGMVSLIKKGEKPTADTLLEQIKTSLHVDVTRDQLHNKIRKMKQKYQSNANREVKGEELQFSKTHESKCYSLYKNIWGEKDVKVDAIEATHGGMDSVKKEVKIRSRKPINAVASSKSEDPVVSPQVPNEVSTLVEQAPILSSLHYLNEIESGKNSIEPTEGLKGFLAKEAIRLIGSSKANDLEQKWKKLRIAEAELYLQRIGLVQEQAKLVLDALKSSEE